MTTNFEQTPSASARTVEDQSLIQANVFQMAMLNKMLPRGYKFELLENALKMIQTCLIWKKGNRK